MNEASRRVGNAGLTFHRAPLEIGSKPRPLIEVGPADVHVWGFLLDLSESELTCASHLLSRDEHERIHRFVSELPRRQLMAAHAGLRVLLSRYCGVPPQELVIQKAAAGKPSLKDFPSIRFNLTHSHGRALIAVAKDRDVGIDLEKVRPEVDVVRLAQRFLSCKDQAFIESGEPTGRHVRFLQAWVTREAAFKAEGKGLVFPLHHDYVELTRDGTEGCLVLGDGTSERAVKPVRFLPLEPGWVGAVAAEGTEWIITYRAWTES